MTSKPLTQSGKLRFAQSECKILRVLHRIEGKKKGTSGRHYNSRNSDVSLPRAFHGLGVGDE